MSYNNDYYTTMLERIRDLYHCGIDVRAIALHLGLMPGDVEALVHFA